MNVPNADANRMLMDAVAFAARAHVHQKRKDGVTPYASHAFRVCLIIRHVFGIDDNAVLTAALLHDTIEDTTTDYDDIAKCFNRSVADWVAALSKDKRLMEGEREAKYVQMLRESCWQVQVCKLGDIYDNVMDSVHTPAEQQSRTLQNSRRYLDALSASSALQVQRARETVTRLLESISA
jgi:guanosine-3',5'-bis(diphosphate) 3'-pyrophosphohydrolase